VKETKMLTTFISLAVGTVIANVALDVARLVLAINAERKETPCKT